MNRCFVIIGVAFAVTVAAAVADVRVARPRGVSLARTALYAPGPDDSFTCLNGEATFPYAVINDDYCDCSDGSDEPGTSACPNGVFHCANLGHAPLNLVSSRVNDGICDCCDGTDEYGHPDRRCADTCEEKGRAARVREQEKQQLHLDGAKMRADMAARGAQLKREMKERLGRLQADRDEAEALKAEKERLKGEAEAAESVALEGYRRADEELKAVLEEERARDDRREAEETFARYDSDANGLVDLVELQTRVTFDKNRDGQVSVEEARYFLAEEPELPLADFVERAWPLIKPFIMLEKGVFAPPSPGGAAEGVDEENEPERPDEEETETEAEADADNVPGEDDEEGDEDFKGAEEPEGEGETEDEATPQPQYDEETKKLVEAADEARSSLSSAERAVRDIAAEMTKIETSLEKDYGPREEYAVLNGQCLEYTDREYLYRLCPFDKATQQPKNGGAETRLGGWSEWAGPEENRYSSMMYSQGTACWNGPNRSTKVNIECGLETRIVGVSEPNRCEYVFDMITPAACLELERENFTAHDEL